MTKPFSSCAGIALPVAARIPINRCNLPAVILGSLSFQQHPVPLLLDGTAPLFVPLANRLEGIADQRERCACFHDYMQVQFRLHRPQDAGHAPGTRLDRSNANYLRLLRGWFFDSDGRDAAVLRGWVESRFGLLPRYHAGAISNGDDANYRRYLHARTSGLYNTNALEAQLDLVYTFCQYELRRTLPHLSHHTLFRGVNRLRDLEILHRQDARMLLLFNNLSSFSADAQRAGELGAYVIEARIPAEKIFLYPELTGGLLDSEREYLVIGGLYQTRLMTTTLA